MFLCERDNLVIEILLFCGFEPGINPYRLFITNLRVRKDQKMNTLTIKSNATMGGRGIW